MKTGNLPALQKILGHASPMMTQRYAHLSNGYLQAEMRAFNSCIPITQETALKVVPMDTYMDTKEIKAFANIVELPMVNADVAQR